MKLKHARDGQLVTSEYVLLFFVAVAGISAMTVFVQRGLQAKQRDMSHYMVDLATEACVNAVVNGVVDCVGAAGFNAAAGEGLPYEYEPYYTLSNSDVKNGSGERRTMNPAGTWMKDMSVKRDISSDGIQRPPSAAN